MDCYTLTEAVNNQVGAVWVHEVVDITSSFTIDANLYFGTKDLEGADGIAFVIQNQLKDSDVGGDGGRLGFIELLEYFAVDVDTYYNHNLDGDIANDHVYVSSGIAGIGDSFDVGNVEDDKFHRFRVAWNAGSGSLDVYLDDMGAPKLTRTVESISDQFPSKPTSAFFGFTATTGGKNNVQKVCDIVLVSTPGVVPASTSAHEECGDYAVHGGTTVTFALPGVTIDGGDVSGLSVVGPTNIALNDGSFVADSTVFLATELVSHAAAMGAHPTEVPMDLAIGGQTFLPGIYRSPSTLSIAPAGGFITLDADGDSDATFLFIAGTTLGTAANTYVNLVGGAKAENVLWVLGTAATLGADSVLQGSIMAGSAITVGNNAVIHGCLLAQTAITFSGAGAIDLTPSTD
jgi:hypothetical protein